VLVPIGHGPAPGVPLTIGELEYSDAKLLALGWCSYVQGRNPMVFHGQKESDGRFFRPVVTFEIATEGKTKLKKLRQDSEQASSETATVSPERPLLNVVIDMEPFEGWIGTYRYGKVILENGDAAIVALEDLLPRASARDGIGNFKEDIFAGGAMLHYKFKLPRPNDPAVLSNIISLGDQLIGEFIFDSRTQTISLKGTKTLDGDFWPKVTFQVGNSEDDWKEIGKSTNNGVPAALQITERKAETMRILLTDFKPLITKFKYGKVVFSSGQATVFYLNLLDPEFLAQTQ
jgi:hypothetical protein